MFNMNTMLLVGIAAFAILTIAPVAIPLIENLLHSMDIMPRRY